MYHKLTIIGNLGSDPELRYTQDGTAVCSFSLASNRQWKNKDGSKGQETVWFRVSAWRGLGETIDKYLSKGRQVYVEGRLTPDKETGSPRVYQNKAGAYAASYEVTATEVKFLGSRGDGDLVDVAKGMGGVVSTSDDVPF